MKANLAATLQQVTAQNKGLCKPPKKKNKGKKKTV